MSACILSEAAPQWAAFLLEINMSATVTALVRLLMGCIVMAFLIVFMVACSRPHERNIWREMYEAGELDP